LYFILRNGGLKLVGCYHYWYKQASLCCHENRLQGHIADTECTRSNTQPVDILLVSGNLSVSSEDPNTRVNDQKKKKASNLVNIVIPAVSFFI